MISRISFLPWVSSIYGINREGVPLGGLLPNGVDVVRLEFKRLKGWVLLVPPVLFAEGEPNPPGVGLLVAMFPNGFDEPAGLLKGEVEANTLGELELLVKPAGFAKVAWPKRPPVLGLGALDVFEAFEVRFPNKFGASAVDCVAGVDARGGGSLGATVFASVDVCVVWLLKVKNGFLLVVPVLRVLRTLSTGRAFPSGVSGFGIALFVREAVLNIY